MQLAQSENYKLELLLHCCLGDALLEARRQQRRSESQERSRAAHQRRAREPDELVTCAQQQGEELRSNPCRGARRGGRPRAPGCPLPAAGQAAALALKQGAAEAAAVGGWLASLAEIS